MHLDPATASVAIAAVRAYMTRVRSEPYRGYTDLYIANVSGEVQSAQQWARAELKEARRVLAETQGQVDHWPRMMWFRQELERAQARVIAAEQLVDAAGA